MLRVDTRYRIRVVTHQRLHHLSDTSRNLLTPALDGLTRKVRKARRREERGMCVQGAEVS